MEEKEQIPTSGHQVTVTGGDAQSRAFITDTIHTALTDVGFTDIVHAATVGVDWTDAKNQTKANNVSLLGAIKEARPELFSERVVLSSGIHLIPSDDDDDMASELGLAKGETGRFGMIVAPTEHPANTEELDPAPRLSEEELAECRRRSRERLEATEAWHKLEIRQELFDELENCGMLKGCNDDAMETFINEGSTQRRIIELAKPYMDQYLEGKTIFGINMYNDQQGG